LVLVEISNVTKEFTNGNKITHALNGINISVEARDFTALMGPSGSGKSTLLSIMGALHPPSSGKVDIDNIDVYSLNNERRADLRSIYIGFVFQQFQLVPYLTALENVMLPLAISGLSHRQQLDKAKTVLDKVGLQAKYNRLPNQLSGGEQQRVGIARAIVNKPPLILADEPTGSLDSATSREIMDIFKSLNEEGLTVIIVTHDRSNLHHVKKVVCIKDGKICSTEDYRCN
jgi:putative ABC transport system ATP-binding protein